MTNHYSFDPKDNFWSIHQIQFSSNLFSLLHALLSRDQICSLWSSSKPGVEVDPLVQVPGRQGVKKQGHLGLVQVVGKQEVKTQRHIGLVQVPGKQEVKHCQRHNGPEG